MKMINLLYNGGLYIIKLKPTKTKEDGGVGKPTKKEDGVVGENFFVVLFSKKNKPRFPYTKLQKKYYNTGPNHQLLNNLH